MIFDIEKWVHSNKSTKFEWGVSDCCLFTCDYVKTVTGVDPAENHRGHYSSEIGAKKALVKYGTIEESFNNCGFETIGYHFAKRGDVVLYSTDDGDALGIKWTGGVLGLNENGVVVAKVTLSQVVSVWKIINE